jgi:hypothetical protein
MLTPAEYAELWDVPEDANESEVNDDDLSPYPCW